MLGKNLYVSTIVRTIKRGRIEDVKETETTYEFKVEGKKKLYIFEKYDFNLDETTKAVTMLPVVHKTIEELS